MKSLVKNMLIAASIFGTAAAMTACGSSGGNNNPVVAVNANCLAPNVINGLGQCISPNGQIIYSGANRLYSQVSQGAMQITNGTAYQSFLKSGMAVCDRWSGSNKGTSSCQDSWANGDMLIVLDTTNIQSNQMSVTIDVSAGNSSYYEFHSGVETNLPYRKPLVMQTVLSAINNSQGFEARQNVNLKLFQLQVASGKLQDNQIGFQLAWDGQVFATGTLYRY